MQHDPVSYPTTHPCVLSLDVVSQHPFVSYCKIVPSAYPTQDREMRVVSPVQSQEGSLVAVLYDSFRFIVQINPMLTSPHTEFNILKGCQGKALIKFYSDPPCIDAHIAGASIEHASIWEPASIQCPKYIMIHFCRKTVLFSIIA